MNISLTPTRSAISPSERFPQPGLLNWKPEKFRNERAVNRFVDAYASAGAGGTTVTGPEVASRGTRKLSAVLDGSSSTSVSASALPTRTLVAEQKPLPFRRTRDPG